MSPMDERVFASDLINRWDKMFSFRGTATSGNRKAAASHLVGAYQQSGRRYHRLGHLIMIRAELRLERATDSPKFEFADREGLELAIDVHDVIQGLTSEFDVNDSTRWIRTLLAAWGIDPGTDFPSLIPCLRATEHHPSKEPGTPDAELLADADLAILGQNEAVYGVYERAIRAEFGWIPDDIYKVGRTKALEGFAKRPHIYRTTHFRELYEEVARANITNELLVLHDKLGEPVRTTMT